MDQSRFFIILFAFLMVPSLFAGESRIEKITHPSPALGDINRTLNIYLPEDYDEDTTKYYPVIYLYRGDVDEWVTGDQDASRQGRNIKTLMDQLYSEGEIGKMIVVMPDWHFIYVNSALDTLYDSLLYGNFQMEDYYLQDLIPYIDSNYRTLPNGAQRGADGFSFGGSPAIRPPIKFPELFSSAGAYDGALYTWLNFDIPGGGPMDDPWIWDMGWWLLWGDTASRDIEYMKTYSISHLVHDADPEQLEKIKTVQFLIHTVPPFFDIGLRDLNLHILGIMEDKGLVNEFADQLVISPGAEHNWWWADEHMLLTLPLHWQKFQNPDTTRNTMPLQVISPNAEDEISGITDIIWSVGKEINNRKSFIAYNNDGGKVWNDVTALINSDSVFAWDTESVKDGTRYRLRVTTIGDSDYAVNFSTGLFTVNNPGNGAPDIEVLTPQVREIVSGEYLITYFSADADGDMVTRSIEYSADDGETWNLLADNLTGENSYIWDTRNFPNGPDYRLALHGNDGTVTTSDTTESFEVFNERIVLATTEVGHKQGNSSAIVSVNVADANQLTDDLYQVFFDDTTYDYTVYDVYNATDEVFVVESATELDGLHEGPLFDGMRLLIRDYEDPEVDDESTGWVIGDENFDVTVFLPEVDLGDEILKGYPFPADYRVNWFDQVVDTSSGAFGAPVTPMKFLINRLEKNSDTEIAVPVDVIFLDNDLDNTASESDEIYILEYDDADMPFLVWGLSMSGSSGDYNPEPGDEYTIRTLKPLDGEDLYEFRADTVTALAEQENMQPGEFRLEQNFPNPFNPQTIISFTVPEKAIIQLNVYDVLGREVVKLIDGVRERGTHNILWEGINQYGEKLASGIYFYQLRSGEHILQKKMLLLR